MRKINPIFIVVPLIIVALLMMIFGGNINLFNSTAETTPDPQEPTAASENLETDVPTAVAELNPTDTPPTDIPPTDVPIVESAPTATATETAIAVEDTAAVPTDEPTPTSEPTAIPTPATFDIVQSGVSLAAPTALQITDVTFERIPAQQLVDGPPLYLTDVPEYLRLTLDTPQGAAVMLIRPIRDTAGDFYASQDITQIQYFNAFETQLTAGSDGRSDQKQLAYLDFGTDGSALRAVSYQFETQEIQKITDEALFYYFDGISTNGRYYVSLAYPIQSGQLEPAGNFSEEELAVASADYQTYIDNTLAVLDPLTAADFTPSLEQLDQLVQSITIADDASTEVSPFANDPNCSNFAAYVRDVTINDAQIINPGEPFTKIWEVANNGSCNWTPLYTATFLDGSEIGWDSNADIELTRSGENLELALNLIAPQEAGIYQGRWQLANEAGETFGDILYIAIVVPEEPIAVTPTATPEPVVLAESTPEPAATAEPKVCTDEHTFVADVTIPDGTTINPGEPFTKIWEIRNSGSCTWDASYFAQFSDGATFSANDTVPIDPVLPNETVQISINFIAPQEPGIYESRWTVVNDQGQPFGPLVYVTIFVPTEPIPTPTATPAP